MCVLCNVLRMPSIKIACHAGAQNYETFLWNTDVLYYLLVVYTFMQALVIILLLCSFIQRW